MMCEFSEIPNGHVFERAYGTSHQYLEVFYKFSDDDCVMLESKSSKGFIAEEFQRSYNLPVLFRGEKMECLDHGLACAEIRDKLKILPDV